MWSKFNTEGVTDSMWSNPAFLANGKQKQKLKPDSETQHFAYVRERVVLWWIDRWIADDITGRVTCKLVRNRKRVDNRHRGEKRS